MSSGREWRFEECAASRCQLFPGLELKEKPEEKEYPAAE